MAEQACKEMSKEGIAIENMVLLNSADLRYRGQAYEVNIPIPNALTNAEDLAKLAIRFNGEHSRRYGYCSEESSVEMVNMRVTAIGNLTVPQMVAFPQTNSKDPGTALLEERNVYFHGAMVKTPVFLAGRLQPGHVIRGPAIIQDTGSTTVLFPGQTAGVDPYKNLIVRLEF